jgi:hypothetical protein
MTRKEQIQFFFGALVNRPATFLPASESAPVLVLKQEMWHYFNSAPIELCTKIGAQEWWKSHEVLYPYLSFAISVYHCFSAPCIHVFYKGGWLVSKRHSSLSPNCLSTYVLGMQYSPTTFNRLNLCPKVPETSCV